MKEFKFIDLFAGIGGLRIPFEEIGGKCVFTSEIDEYCKKTYQANFNDSADHNFVGNIRDYSDFPEKIPSHDILLAGFPCQPFSRAGVSKRNSLNIPHGFMCDVQGTLFYDIVKIIAHHKPKVVLLENVKNLEHHDNGHTFATIKNILENELGYKIFYKVINSDKWVPQKRQRIFIICVLDHDVNIDFGDMKHPEITPLLGDILMTEEVDKKYTLSDKLWNYLQDYKEKHSKAGNGFGYSLCDENDVARTLSARYYKDGSEILIKQNGANPRRLTPTECKHLMGFPDNFKIVVSDFQAYRQFGNSVVVPVVRELAKLIEPII